MSGRKESAFGKRALALAGSALLVTSMIPVAAYAEPGGAADAGQGAAAVAVEAPSGQGETPLGAEGLDAASGASSPVSATSVSSSASDAGAADSASASEAANSAPSAGSSPEAASDEPVLPGIVETVDSRADHIAMNLFDYPNGYDRTGVNGYTDYYFRNPLRFNHWMSNYANGSAVQGIVKDRLGEDGYPVLNSDDERSMAYLFDPAREEEGRVAYADVSHLLSKDGKGYYSYDSDLHYAWYPSDKGGGDFVVYDKTYKVPYKGLWPVGFVPFNAYDEGNTDVSPRGPFDHHFGLTMTAGFKIPENAQVDGEDMVFDFSGDDDAWVFVDGVLVLDIGGIHDKRTGSINFATGDVTVDQVAATVPGRPSGIQTIGAKSNLHDIFARQNLAFDGSKGSSHTLSFFYVERGGYLSNLLMRFNLPTVVESVPTPDPEPEPVPDPDPDPEPNPDPVPDPDPDPEPNPDPVPDPHSDPEPVPDPDPTPDPDPSPSPEPEPVAFGASSKGDGLPKTGDAEAPLAAGAAAAAALAGAALAVEGVKRARSGKR